MVLSWPPCWVALEVNTEPTLPMSAPVADMGPRVEGPSPAWAVALDMARRSLWLLPVLVLGSALFGGLNGVLSTGYALVIHCGACMLTRRQMLARLRRAERQGVAMTNYGVAIPLLQGVLARALQCFPAALLAYEDQVAMGRK